MEHFDTKTQVGSQARKERGNFNDDWYHTISISPPPQCIILNELNSVLV